MGIVIKWQMLRNYRSQRRAPERLKIPFRESRSILTATLGMVIAPDRLPGQFFIQSAESLWNEPVQSWFLRG
jgi:hypothetical protein